MYFAHFTVSGVSVPLLCDSVFASCCGKHNIAMIAHAFQKAENTAEEPKHSFSPSRSPSIPPLPLPPPVLSLTSSQGIQLPWLQTHIMTASPGGQRRYPTDAERLYPVVTLQEICRQCTLEPGELWEGTARSWADCFLLIKWSANCAGLVCIGTAHCFLPLRGQGERHGSISVNTL